MQKKMMRHFDMAGNEVERPVDQVVPGATHCLEICDANEYQDMIPPSLKKVISKLNQAGEGFRIAVFEPPLNGIPVPVLVPDTYDVFVMRPGA